MTNRGRITFLAAMALPALAAGMAMAQDAVDLDRLCRPGPSSGADLAEAFKTAGWQTATPDTAMLIHGLAMVSPLLGDIDADIIANAIPLATEALPSARIEIDAALHLTGPEGTALAILPVAPPDDGYLRVKCLAVFPPSHTLQDVTLPLADLSVPMGSPTITTVTGYEDGLMGGVHVFVVRPEDYGWADLYTGGLLQVIWRGKPAS